MSRSLETLNESLLGFEDELAKFDRNHNGVLEDGEDPELETVMLVTADLNRDGRLDRAEYDASLEPYRSASYGIHGLRAPGPGEAGDLTKTHLLWRKQKVPKIPSPLFYQDRLPS